MAISIDELLRRAQAIRVDDETISEMEEWLCRAEEEFARERRLKEADPKGFLEYQYVK